MIMKHLQLTPKIIPGILNQYNRKSCDWGWHNLFAYGCDNAVIVIDLEHVQIIQTLEKYRSSIIQVKWCNENFHHDLSRPYKCWLAACDTSGHILIWDVLAGMLVSQCQEGKKAVQDIKWLPNQDQSSNLLLAIHPPSSLVLWNVSSGHMVWKKSYQDTLIAADIDPFDPHHLAVLGTDCLIFLDDFQCSKAPQGNGRKFCISVPQAAAAASSTPAAAAAAAGSTSTNISPSPSNSSLSNHAGSSSSTSVAVSVGGVGGSQDSGSDTSSKARSHHPSRSNAATAIAKRMRALVIPAAVHKLKSNSSDELQQLMALEECIQMCFHPACRHHLLLVYSKEVLIIDLEINQTVCVMTADRNACAASFLQVYPCHQRDVIYCLHDNGSISVRVRQYNTCSRTEQMLLSQHTLDLMDADQFHEFDVVYECKSQSEPARLTRHTQCYGMSCSPVTELDCMGCTCS